MERSSIHRAATAAVVSLVVPMVLLVGGCVGTRYRRPAVPIPPGYRGDASTPPVPGPASNGQPASLGELRWQDLIQDEGLSKLIGEAVANNLDAQIAAARVLEARAQLTIARSARIPSVDAGARYTNLRLAENGSVELPPGTQTDTDYSDLSVSLGWELDLWATGTVLNVNSPLSSAWKVRDQSEVAACNLTEAPARGRCCGSWTIPCILPKIVA